MRRRLMLVLLAMSLASATGCSSCVEDTSDPNANVPTPKPPSTQKRVILSRGAQAFFVDAGDDAAP